MKMLFKEANIKPIIAGFIKKSKLFRRLLPLKTGGSNSSRYCYSIWMRHLIKLNSSGKTFLPGSVAELGPGDSLGIGISALLSGANEYFALDIQKYWKPLENVQMLDELLKLFIQNEPIPADDEFPNVSPKLVDYNFPKSILTAEILKKSLAPDRIEAIRNELMHPENRRNKFIKYYIPWSDPNIIRDNSVDLILSQAVLEHVDELENTYNAMLRWLKVDGLMSHTIDFKSHGFTKSWNGHWTLSDWEWRFVRGGRVYAINREPFTTHLKFIEQNGFQICIKELKLIPTIITTSQLSKPFNHLTYEEITVGGMYVIAIKHDQ